LTDPVLAIDHLSVDYQTDKSRLLALDDVSLSLGRSEILGVVGESGCGKSTLGMAILRLLPSNGRVVAGSIRLEAQDLSSLSAEEMRSVRGRQIAMIFQDPATSLNPRLPIGRQLLQVQRAHARRRAGSKTDLRRNAVDRLAEVGLPNPSAAFNRYPHELSGGMRQRVVIAMALLFEPKVIVADEATSALDVTLEAQILELLLRLRDEHGTSMVFISHDLGVVSQLCDRVTVMYAGRVVEEINGEAVLAAPRHPYTQALDAAVPNLRSRGKRLCAIPGRVPTLTDSIQACAFAPRCVRAELPCTEAVPELYEVDSGSVRCFAYAPTVGSDWSAKPTIEDWHQEEAEATSPAEPGIGDGLGDEPLLDLRDLAVHFGGARKLLRHRKAAVRAVDGVSLALARGRVLGIVGESGSGKTTLGEAVVKLLPPTGGTIRFAGQDVTKMSRTETLAFRRRAQMIFQNAYSSLSPRMQIGSLVVEPYEIHQLPLSERRQPQELLDAVGLPASLGAAYPGQISGGQARRVGIARALALEPDLVVADEPTAGLDASSAAATVNLLSDLRARMGLTVVLISHNLSLVATSADEVCVMYLGRVVEYGETQEVINRPAHPYTRALLAVAPDPERAARTVRRRLLAPGEIPSPDSPPSGCHFHPRCAYSQDICRSEAPVLAPVGRATRGHVAACHFAEGVQAGAAPEEAVAGDPSTTSPAPG
jgi:peptide/nickel transport system ATP-binding protein